MSGRLNRRSFLRRAGVAGTAGAALTAGFEVGAAADDRRSLTERIPFEGAHQAGIAHPRQPHAAFVAFDAIADDAADLADAVRALSDRARMLTAGGRLPAAFGGITQDSGILGPYVEPDRLTVTIGFGASLFDDRYGLARRRPLALTPMRTFPNDQLDPAECHGDLFVQLCSGSIDTNLHALRDLMRATRGLLAARWKIEGFVPPDRSRKGGLAVGRNLLGFHDGIANPGPDELDRLVWTGADEPAWARGGTYGVVRIIRNRVEFWDRVSLREQENMIGRRKDSGIPLSGGDPHSTPDYKGDPDGERVPLDAHIRLANPRTPAQDGSRILRRGYNYTRGTDAAGQLDQGLVFVCFQRNVKRQFEVVQKRLVDEPLVDYVVPTGGGYFFMPPGARDREDWVGSGLFI